MIPKTLNIRSFVTKTHLSRYTLFFRQQMSPFYLFRGGVAERGQCHLFLPFFYSAASLNSLTLTYYHLVHAAVGQDREGPLVQVHDGVVGPLVPGWGCCEGFSEAPVNHWIRVQPDNQVVSVLPTFLEEGKVADVEEVKGSRHIDYPVTLLWTLTEDIKWKIL